jgi:hypothetical protein
LAFAGSIYALSTLAFGVLAIVIGVRLLRLSRRTGHRPERYLGLGVMMTAGLGYLVMVVASAIAPTWETAGRVLGFAGTFFHQIGVTAILAFVVLVFRRNDAWAKALAWAVGVTLWLGFGSDQVYQAIHGVKVSPFYWVVQVVICLYPLWMAAESLRYHGRMRRQLALGLADPMVTNRFLLWGLGSLTTTAAIWTISVPIFVRAAPLAVLDMADPLVEVALLVTALFGIATIGLYWLTFFPPDWYRSAVTRSAQASAA